MRETLIQWRKKGRSGKKKNIQARLNDKSVNTNYTAHTASDLIGYKPSFQLLDGPSPGAWSDIWLVNLALMNLAASAQFRLIHCIKRAIRSIASVILLVSLSAVGADRFEEPKLLKSKAKKRLSTCLEMRESWDGIRQKCSFFFLRSKQKVYLFLRW